ncbi:triggering receptor expressed on myeloid cells 1 [Erinaceus europaeus]|uniref:Triggering receptor expressed on myeloid cells 1 n=1 Tax=Erinaceus europaeus TaxID=9365 RepID=A0ABM3XAB2_ERIEU|nr:triggering receptor expressed on myeloid cells 1 [Erinaceus europaeus]
MRKATLEGMLWLLFLSVSGFQAAAAAAAASEEKHTLMEGQTLTVIRHVSIWKYANSRKAWQRLLDGGKPLTLAVTERPSGTITRVQVGRYFLEDEPSEAVLRVQMTNLQVEDSGLYRCVILHASKEPDILSLPIRLVVTRDPSGPLVSDKTSTQDVPQVSTHPPTTILTWHKFPTSPRTMTLTQLLPKTTTSISTLGGTGITTGRELTRTSVISIAFAVVCGLLSKSLVFTILLVITQRSFGS